MNFVQFQVSETVFDTINHEYDEKEKKKINKKKIAKFGNDEKDSDVILHGYVKKLVSWVARFRSLVNNCVIFPRGVLLSQPGSLGTPSCILTG